MSGSSHELFRTLWRDDILKLDLADLDFGIYRILKYRRQNIEKLLDREIPHMIAQNFSTQSNNEMNALENQIAARQQHLEKLFTGPEGAGLESIYETDTSILHPLVRETPAGKELTRLQTEYQRKRARRALEPSEENRFYNVLYTFFARYYRDGDFLPQMRRATTTPYAVPTTPYHGEDIHFHWRSRGNHYIKTTEELRLYTCVLHGWSVRFELHSADEEQDNRKGKTRYFLPLVEHIQQEAQSRTLVVPFTFRPLTEEEEAAVVNENTSEDRVMHRQERLLKSQSEDILAHLPADLPFDDLYHHMHRYARKNRTDYFVHTHVGAFLRAEFDYYLKSEYFSPETMTNTDQLSDWLIKYRTLRDVGYHLIDLLDGIESFQARLFEKRKFVLQTDYLVTVRVLPESLYERVLANEAQHASWRTLFKLDGEITLETLRQHPTLVIDTRHFNDDFKRDLLSSLENVDGMCDGVLINAENYAALRTLEPTYRQRVKVIYIDPPYNTGNDGFLYKDDFSRHSTWLSMMESRLRLARELLSDDGVLFVSIDYNEEPHLRLLLDEIFGGDNYRNTFVVARVKKTIQERASIRRLNWGHNILLFYAKSQETLVVPPMKKQVKKERWHPLDAPGVRSTMEYELFGWKPPEGRHWMYEEPRARAMIEKGELRQNPKTGKPEYKLAASSETTLDTNWTDILESASEWFDNGENKGEKNVAFIQRILSTVADNDALVLDFFAGSGTTAHAVIQQNRDNDGNRRFILVEVEDHFDSILLPRIQKVIYAPLGSGEPKETPFLAPGEQIPVWIERSPRLVKILRLESYEDSLNALEPPMEDPQGRMFDNPALLRYLMPADGNDSHVLLNCEHLETPFTYRLNITTPAGIQETVVDIVETTNLLLGLYMRQRRELDDDGRRYVIVIAEREEQSVLVVWRDVPGLDPARERTFLTEQIDFTQFDLVYTNADSVLPHAQSLDALLKTAMLAGASVGAVPVSPNEPDTEEES